MGKSWSTLAGFEPETQFLTRSLPLLVKELATPDCFRQLSFRPKVVENWSVENSRASMQVQKKHKLSIIFARQSETVRGKSRHKTGI